MGEPGAGRPGFRGRIGLVVIAFFLAAPSLPAQSNDSLPVYPVLPSPPFQRAMLLTAGGFDVGVNLGMYDAAVDAGYPPDVIFGTSGGALTASIIAAFPDPAARKAYLASPAFHALLLSVHIEGDRPLPFLLHTFLLSAYKCGLPHRPPDLFRHPLASMPERLLENTLDIPFPTGAQRPRVILIAGRLESCPRAGATTCGETHTETCFTDAQTGAYFSGLNSAIGLKYPKSNVRAPIAVVTSASLSDGMRASVAEPHLFRPVFVQGHYYTGGVIDLYPVELAQTIACECIVPRRLPLDYICETLGYSAMPYSQEQRKREIDRMAVALRVDLTSKDWIKDASFWIGVDRIDPKKSLPQDCEQDHKHLLRRFRITNKVPEDHDEFLRCLGVQWSYGYQQTQQALEQKNCCAGRQGSRWRFDWQ